MNTSSALRLTLPCIAALLAAVPAAAQQTWQTYPDDQDPESLFYNGGPTYPWVFYDCRYSQPGQTQYKGVWRQANAWPGSGSSVTLRHLVSLNNNAYYPHACDPAPNPNPPSYPFGSGDGELVLNSLNIEPGGGVASSLTFLRFAGGSTWNGAHVSSNPGRLHNQGDLVIASASTIGSGGEFLNTNRISIPSTLGIEFGQQSLTNQSGTLPDPFYAEIALTQPGASIVQAQGGGGFGGYITNNGVIRKAGGGTSTVGVILFNHTDSSANRAGTIQVDSGTLAVDGFYAEYHGLKAEIAPGALLLPSGSQRFKTGTVTVTGGGVLRFPAGTVAYNPAADGTAFLAADEGKLECAGAEMRDLVNTGSINVTADSAWRSMVNLGHVRQINSTLILGGVTNGSAANSSAVWDLEDNAGFAPQNIPPTVYNYGFLRKSGPGTSVFDSTSLINYGSATDPNAGRIEVTGGVLRFPNQLHFNNGGRIRVASGTTLEMASTIYFDNTGTLTLTGSGKVRLLPGSSFRAGNDTVTGTLNAAPGTWEFNGGGVTGPANNTGEITVTAFTRWDYGFFGSNTITNSGTIHFLATSAGSLRSMDFNALVGMDCTPASVLAFDIAGRPGEDTQWARMRFAGQNFWTIGGKLRINFGNFTPVSGDRWRVIDYQSGSNPPGGSFAALEFANVPPGFVPVLEKVGTGSNFGYEVVLNAAPAPVNYNTWAAAQGFPTPAAAAFDVDQDGDGFTNGLECALGTNPQSRGSRPDMTTARKDSGGDIFLAAQFKRPGAALRPTDLQYIAERTDTLGGWTSTGVVMEVSPLDAQGNETIVIRPVEPMDYKQRTFVRLRVQRQ